MDDPAEDKRADEDVKAAIPHQQHAGRG